MTLGFDVWAEVDVEEIPIENSHLVRGRCRCGAMCVHAPGRRARCAPCLLAETGAGEGVAAWRGRYGPVVSFAPTETVPAAPVAREPYPAPEWTSRDAEGALVPPLPVVSGLAERGRAAGWDVRVQCARGRRPHGSTGKPLASKTTHAVVLSRNGGEYAAYAVHDQTSWSSVMIWGRAVPFFPLASITDLYEYVDTLGRVDASWFDAIRARVGESAARTKARAQCNIGVHPLAETQGGVAWCPTCLNSWNAAGDPWRKPKVGKSEAN